MLLQQSVSADETGSSSGARVLRCLSVGALKESSPGAPHDQLKFDWLYLH